MNRPSNDTRAPLAHRGFTLVELLVVIGIIALLIGILLPTLSRARERSKAVVCMSNLKQVYIGLEIYSQNWRGWMFPPELGKDPAVPRDQRWPIHVFKPAVWNPPILKCPSDQLEPVPEGWPLDQPENGAEHSYILNEHLKLKAPKFSNKAGGRSDSDVILMGEKVTIEDDYYMELMGTFAQKVSDFGRLVELYRHGRTNGSNYLFKDGHVDTAFPKDAVAGIDPWDVPASSTTQPVP
jgi:prepilin-type N-terminal cleavage/methylation domain-containing protein/prepilin-type processing-associated H-X9-DG protein